MSNRVRPRSITLNKQDKERPYLEIEWADDKVCQYPLPQLREACPCVECRGGHAFMGIEHAPDNLLELKPARSYNITEIHPVGNYAIQPFWDDGHSTGIYTWDYLRYLCPEDEDTESG